MLHAHTNYYSLYLLYFFPAQVSGLSSLLTETLLCIHCILPPPFFPLCFASNSLDKRCVPAVFSFRTLSNRPVDLLSLSVHVCPVHCSVRMRLSSEARTRETLHCSNTDNDKCTPRPDCCSFLHLKSRILNIFLISQDGVTHIGPQKQVQEPQIGTIYMCFQILSFICQWKCWSCKSSCVRFMYF